MSQRNGVINLTKLQFQTILTRNFDALERYELIEFDRRLWLNIPSIQKAISPNLDTPF